MLGALTPAATAAIAYALMGTMERATTYAALLPVMLGIIMATGSELSFSAIGFTCAVGGCLARAFKTVLQVNYPPLKDSSRIMAIALCSNGCRLACF